MLFSIHPSRLTSSLPLKMNSSVLMLIPKPRISFPRTPAGILKWTPLRGNPLEQVTNEERECVYAGCNIFVRLIVWQLHSLAEQTGELTNNHGMELSTVQ